MAVPAFSFTARATPVAQIGRNAPVDEIEVTWVDIGCDVHEITTDTGRGSASDRFVPGTAVITASNLSGWADGTVPVHWSYFADTFDRSGPALGSNWVPWTPMQDSAGADMLVLHDSAAEVTKHVAAVDLAAGPAPQVVAGGCELVGSWSDAGGAAAGADVGPFPGLAAGDVIWLYVAVQLEGVTAAATWTHVHGGAWGGSGARVDMLQHRVSAEEAATGEPWTFTWGSPGEVAPWVWIAAAVRGATEPARRVGQVSGGTTSVGYFWSPAPDDGLPTGSDGCVVLRFAANTNNHDPVSITAAPVVDTAHAPGWGGSAMLAFEGGADAPALPGGTTIAERHYTFTSPPDTGIPEALDGVTIIALPGLAPDPVSRPYAGTSCAIWQSPYDGDHFVQTVISGLQAPEFLWGTTYARIELALHANDIDVAADVAVLEWHPEWTDPDVTGRLDWSLDRRAADGSWAGPFSTGEVVYAAAGIPAELTVRFDGDTDGGVHLFIGGVLVGEAVDPAPAVGDLVAVYGEYRTGTVSYGRTHQMGPPRFESVAGGSNVPVPILLEPGVRVRIGVDHQVHGPRWFFHGYVDAIVPTYDPTRRPVSQIQCIDSFGEVGRLPIGDIGGRQPEEAWERVTRLLDEAAWPVGLRAVGDDATLMDNSSTSPDRAVEMLTQTAESCGGAIYGDPATGQVVFRGRDWQGWDPDLPPDGHISNGTAPPGALAACPVSWERSWKREDMTTRATLKPAAGDEQLFTDVDAENRFGVEPYERNLVCTEARIVGILGRRQLKLRGPGVFPRVAAVLLDAGTGDGPIDVMTLSTFTGPSRYRCGLYRSDIAATVFDRQYLVTGVRHTISRDVWQCRLALDAADVFATRAARWGRGHWGVGRWGRAI